MMIKKFIPQSSPNVLNEEPFLKIGRSEGCGATGCHCSDGYWVSVSDGKVGLLVNFGDKEEFESYLK